MIKPFILALQFFVQMIRPSITLQIVTRPKTARSRYINQDSLTRQVVENKKDIKPKQYIRFFIPPNPLGKIFGYIPPPHPGIDLHLFFFIRVWESSQMRCSCETILSSDNQSSTYVLVLILRFLFLKKCCIFYICVQLCIHLCIHTQICISSIQPEMLKKHAQ